MIYELLDWFFVIFHSVLIIFNLFGWVLKPLRKANLISLILTGASWTLLGIYYGLGYCPLTDWHWHVLEKLGKLPNTSSYVAYLFHRILSIDITDDAANILTTIAYLTALCLSVFLNIRGWWSKAWLKSKIS